MSSSDESTTLTTTELQEFELLDHVITAGFKTFEDVGKALMQIRDRRLYRWKFRSFDAYLNDHHGITRGRASQLILAAQAVADVQETTAGDIENQEVSTMVDTSAAPVPTSERQARPLTKLENPDDRREAWAQATKAAKAKGKKAPTAKDTADAVQQVKAKRKAPAADSSPQDATPTAPPKPTAPPAPKPTGPDVIEFVVPAEPQTIDELGQPLPPELVDAFKFRDVAAYALKQLAAIKRAVNPYLGDGDEVKPIAGGDVMGETGNRQDFERDYKNLRHALAHARPYALCPYDHKAGRVCPQCKGIGWIVEAAHKNLPGELKGAKGAA
jgi:hypothetical protein